MKKQADQTIACCSCGLRVLMKGDRDGWKGLQRRPDSVEMDWFCPKDICRQAFNAGLVEAKRAWGMAPEPKGDGDAEEEV